MWFLTTWNTSIVDASEICTKPTPCTASARASSNCSRTWLSETQKHCSTVFRGRTSSAHRLRKKNTNTAKKKSRLVQGWPFFQLLSQTTGNLSQWVWWSIFCCTGHLLFHGIIPEFPIQWTLGPPLVGDVQIAGGLGCFTVEEQQTEVVDFHFVKT